ncbi:phosphotransferase [Actinophytocola sp.]|uniref:phosphotransferase n=1 Tax=Actinophytocola sp. TaxID=1872138 RepID=UPI003D6B6022
MSISREAAVAAATRITADLGLTLTEPRVLKDGSNVLVHLYPSPFVARVATLTAELRPGVDRWLTGDIELASFLLSRGLPVTRPATDPPAGPYDVDGITVALWHYEKHDPARTPDPAGLVASLGELHAAMREFPGRLGADGPRGDLSRLLAILERDRLVDPGVLRLMRAEGERLGERMSALPAQVVHGDAHPGNVLVTPAGVRWNDFEDAWHGPVAWDYACMSTWSGPAWVRAVDGHADPDALAVCRELREVFGVAWYQLMAHRFPERVDDAHAALAKYLDGG